MGTEATDKQRLLYKQLGRQTVFLFSLLSLGAVLPHPHFHGHTCSLLTSRPSVHL